MTRSSILTILLSAVQAGHLSAQGELRLRNLDSLPGHLESITPDGILWATPWAGKPLAVPQSAILGIDLPARQPHLLAENHVRLSLANGGLIDGNLDSLSGESLIIETAEAGRLTLLRDTAARLDFHRRADLVYRSLGGLEGWDVAPAGSWASDSLDLQFREPGSITRDIGPVRTFSASFVGQSPEPLNFDILLFAREDERPGDKASGGISASRIMIRQSMGLMLFTSRNADAESVPIRHGLAKPMRIEIFADLNEGIVRVWVRLDGVLANQLPAMFPAGNPVGTRFGFESVEPTPLRITSLEIKAWDGHVDMGPPRGTGPCPPELDLLVLRNNDQVRGKLGGFDQDHTVIDTVFGPLRIPPGRVRSIEFKTAGRRSLDPVAGEVRGWFQDGRPLVFKITGVAGSVLTCESDSFGSASFDLGEFRRIDFNIHERQPEGLHRSNHMPSPAPTAPVTGTDASAADPAAEQDPARGRMPIAVNQVGYVTGRPKRFTAPLAADGTPFVIRHAEGGDALFKGQIRGRIGDFSDFRPAPSDRHYVVELAGVPAGQAASDPFLIRPNLLQEQFWQAAVDFLIDSRSAIGTHPSAFGGCPWRDGTYYDAIVPSLVLLYLADPERVKAMPKQIDWPAEKQRVLAPDFKFDDRDPGAKGFMKAVAAYYELEPPSADAPDVVKLIHWGAGFYLVNPETQDPSDDPEMRKIHAQTVEQVAYVVWAWPVLKQWLPEAFYQKCRDFCFANWEPSLGIGKWWNPDTYLKPEDLVEGNPMGGLLHPFKGRHAPGHSIVPNLLMHEVAKREGRSDAAIYLDAAVNQAEWCVRNLDWNDPRTTKGHRMSEHRTIPNLVWLLQHYPDRAPGGLREKINAWADVTISRSDNLWDYRRYDMENHWSIPKLNDVGNLLAFPAIATATSWVMDDAAKKARLSQLSTAAIDHVFGRNPRLAAAPHKPDFGFKGIERGWPKAYKDDVCARLELCRGSISSAPGSEMFPFKPEGEYRHPEGWVNYGAAWCISLAYLQFDASRSIPKITP